MNTNACGTWKLVLEEFNFYPQPTHCINHRFCFLTNPSKRDFPGTPMVMNLPPNARVAGLIPGWGTKIPGATGQLSPCAATRKPTHGNEDPLWPKT